MRSLLVVCVIVALVALTPAPGAPGSANAETISIAASDNACVNHYAPGTDQSEAETFTLRTCKSVFTYLRFDLSPLADATITSASLDLYFVSPGGDNTASICALKDLANAGLGTTETSWSGNLTWNTRPDGTGNLPNANTSGPFASLDFLSGDPPHLASFDLTSALPGLLESDTNDQLTLMLYVNVGKETKFASLANTKGYPVPTLNVGYEPIPEPGTLALLGMALLGLGWYAWRKRG